LGATSEVRAAVRKSAPALVAQEPKLTGVLEGLRTAKFFSGLTPILDEVAIFHPPAVVAELFRGLLERSGEVAVHFAAMLMFIHGKAEEPFDWDQRPFFLQFSTENRTERVAAIRELCQKIGVDPKTVLPADV
jgi:hypothetical protein